MDGLWYYDVMDINELVLLKEDMGTKRNKTIVTINGFVHLYVIHLIEKLEIIEKPILSLEYDVVTNGNEAEKYTLEATNNEKNDTFDDVNLTVLNKEGPLILKWMFIWKGPMMKLTITNKMLIWMRLVMYMIITK